MAQSEKGLNSLHAGYFFHDFLFAVFFLLFFFQNKLFLKNSFNYTIRVSNSLDPGPEVIKLFSCSTQLSTKFQLLKITKIPTNEEVYCFKSLRCCIYHANKC